MENIRILIADDQVIVAEGLKALLEVVDDFQVVALVSNGQSVLDELEKTQVDLILMDIRMPIMNGVECTSHVKASYPEIKVLILTTFDDDEYIRQALNNGATGYMLKDLSAEKLYAAIRTVYYGNTVMHQKVTDKILSGMNSHTEKRKDLRSSDGNVLTSREKQVLALIGKGYSNGEISQALFLSPGTVKNYITLLYNKLDIKGRTKLMTYAIDAGLSDDN